MSFQPDILAATLQELSPTLTQLFAFEHPLLAKLFLEKRSKSFEGPYLEFMVDTAGPGSFTKIVQGDEKLAQNLRQGAVKGNEFATRMVYSFKVPLKMFAESNSSKTNIVKDLAKRYGALAVSHIHEVFAAQLMRGAASSGALNAGELGADGLITLNGDQNYTPQGPSVAGRTGFFQYAPFASQNATVLGLPSMGAANGVRNWANQYEHVGSSSTDLLNALRRQSHKASQHKLDFGQGSPDQWFMDLESMLSYINVLDEKVRNPEVTVDRVPKGTYDARQPIVCQGGVAYVDQAIDPADTTSFTSANPRQGVIYGIHSASWEARAMGTGKDGETDGWFSFSQAIPVPDEDAVMYRCTFHGQLVAKSRANQVCITGANNP